MKFFKLFAILFFIAFCNESYAQSDRESLRAKILKLDSLVESLSNEKPTEALQYVDWQIQLSEKFGDDSLICLAYISKAELYGTLGVFDLSLNLGFKALRIAEKMKSNYLKKVSCSGIAFQYQSLEDVENSTKFYQKSKMYSILAKVPEDTIFANYEIGFNLFMAGNRDVGMSIMLRNFEKAKEIEFGEAIIIGIDNIANLYFEMGDYHKALQAEYDLFHYRNLWDNNFYKAGVYEHFAEIFTHLKQWDSAQQYLDSALFYSRLIESNNWIYECYKTQSMIDEGKGNYKSALANHKMYLQLKDSVYKAEYNEKISAMTAVYELEKKQEHIAFLEKENDLKHQTIEKQRLQIAGGTGLALFILIISSLVYFILNQRKGKRLLREFSRQLIQNQELERQRIAKELHDSIGQYLLFIKSRIQRLGTDTEAVELKNYVDDAIQEVRGISKDLYPNQLEKYGLEAAMESLCAKMNEMAGIFVSVDMAGIDSYLDKNHKINLYRILQECLNNAIKHSKAESLRVISIFEKGYLKIKVMDNGVGFDKSMIQQKIHTSFGLSNIEERIKLLGGNLHIETFAGKGTKIEMNLPIKN